MAKETSNKNKNMKSIVNAYLKWNMKFIFRHIYITVVSHERQGVSNHGQLDRLFSILLVLLLWKTSKLAINGPLRG